VGHGQFSSDPQAVWLTEDGTEDRNMQVLQTFSFTDPAGKAWQAPKDSVVDGASIPRALWTIVGSPYTGDYRRASIVHDVACADAGKDSKKRRAADRDFQAIVERVLAPGESDDPKEVESRADEALAVVAAIRMPERMSRRAASNPRQHATTVVKRRR
jgi:hypothetical protein